MNEPKKYAKYVHELKWTEGVVNLPEEIKPDRLPLIPVPLRIDQTMIPAMTKWMEVFIITEPSGFGMGGAIDNEKPKIDFDPKGYGLAEDDMETPLIFKDMTVTTHYHRHEEMYLFLGTNPKDPLDLGGELEIWLGIGKYAEKFIITKSTLVLMPPGLAAHPLIFRRVDHPPILQVVVYDNPVYSLIPVDINPPDFKL